MSNENKIIGLIPARFASQRLPGKMLLKIAGKTIIQRVYERVIMCQKLSQVVIVTDHEDIKSHVQDFGATVYMSKTTHESGTDRIGEYVSQLQGFSHVINIQGDEPFINPENIDGLADFIIDKKAVIATQAIKMESDELYNNPNCVKLVTDLNHNALYFSRASIPFRRDRNLSNQTWLRHIGLYAFQKDTLMKLIKLPVSQLEISEKLEQLRWLENGFTIGVQTISDHFPGIDTLEDLEAAELFASRHLL